MKQILENKLYIIIFTVPALLLFSVFVIYPLFDSFYLSLTNSDGMRNAVYIGLKNFTNLFHDKDFWDANNRSLYLSLLAVIFNAIVGIFTAIVLSRLDERLQKYYRAAYLMPMVLSIVVISQLWLGIYSADFGLLNKLLHYIGLGNLETVWLVNPKTAMVCVAIVGMWQYFGFSVLLAFSGIKGIPAQIFEAARIDGANFLQMTFRITLPLMSEVIKICLMLSAVGGLYTFPQVLVMTNGGPGTLTQTMVVYIYKSVIQLQQFGYGSALATVMIVETFIIIIIINKLIARNRVIM